MTSKDAKNAAGLSPEESKNPKERSPEPHEQHIIQGIKEVKCFAAASSENTR